LVSKIEHILVGVKEQILVVEKGKDWLIKNKDNVSERGDMSTEITCF
jgi:hypothetical protein